MPKISLIVAIGKNLAIGKDNTLPWRLPADLKHFKELTTGHTVIMGRKTFESIPNGPLKNRKNIVLTSKPNKNAENHIEVSSFYEALNLCRNEEEVFVIGGAEIFKKSLSLAEKLYITWVHEDFEADVFFPEIDLSKWQEISREDYQADEKNPYNYSFVDYKRGIYNFLRK